MPLLLTVMVICIEMDLTFNAYIYMLSVRMDSLHSTLRQILAEDTLVQQSIDEDTDLAEADQNMNNVNEDVFERGSGEDEIEFGAAEDRDEEEMDV